MLICPTCFNILDEDPAVCRSCGTRRPAIGWEREEVLGKVLDERYEVVQRLGAGATGAVYLAHDQRADDEDQRRVAVKFLHKRLSHEPKLQLRFRREALASSQIANPHVARTLAYGELADGTAYLVMEHIAGRSLHQLMAVHRTIPVVHAVDIAMQIAEALEAAHEAGIVHRDLKPGNIFLVPDEDGRAGVKVLDFGYAFIKSRDRGGTKLTKTGIILGTPTYMSPEQTEGRRDIDGRSDLYALGVVLYRILTGRPPFQADSLMEMVLKHRNETPVAPRQLAPERGIPEDLEAVILKLLSKRRDERYPTARSVREALWPFSSGARGSGEDGDPNQPPELPPTADNTVGEGLSNEESLPSVSAMLAAARGGRSRRKTVLLVAGGVALLAAVVVLLLALDVL